MSSVNAPTDRFPSLRFGTSAQRASSSQTPWLQDNSAFGPATLPSAAAWVAAIEQNQHQEMAHQLRALTQLQAQRMATASGVSLLVEVAKEVQDPGHLDWLLRLLLDHGALPTAYDARGNDALMALLRRPDHPEHASTLLIRRGANVHHRNASGRTALHILLQTTRQHQLAVLQMLLARGVDLTLPTPEGIMPLWLAACSPQGPKLVQAMLEACAPDQIRALLRATSRRHGRELGNAGVAALMHNPDDTACKDVLVQLARAGLDLGETQATACAMSKEGGRVRSYQAYQHLCRAAQERSSIDILSLSPPKFQSGALPQPLLPVPAVPQLRVVLTPPSQELAPPRFLLRPLPQPPPHEAPPISPLAAHRPEPVGPPDWMAVAAHPLESANPPRAEQSRKASPPIERQRPHAKRRPSTLSLHKALRIGPVEAIEAAIAAHPEMLSRPEAARMGARMPLALAVLSLRVDFVKAVLRGMQQHQLLTPEVLDAAGEDGITALSAAIELGGLQQTEHLLLAGASPLLPVLQCPRGIAKMVGGASRMVSRNGAEYAVVRRQPAILRCLLEWDEQKAAQLHAHCLFDLYELRALAHACHDNYDSLVLREVIAAAMARRGLRH